MQIITARLQLREWTMEDIPAAHAIHSDPVVMQYMTGQPETWEGTQATLNRWIERAASRPRTTYNLAVVRRADATLLGRCGLYLTAEPRIAYLGYHIQRAVWGQDYIPEAAQALVQFGFQQLALHRIYAECHPDNHASARVMQKLGMQYEGRLRENYWENNQWWDLLVYGLLAREWTPTNTAVIVDDQVDK